MKKLKVLTIIFNTEISHNELIGFRSAIIEQAGRENILFHNHLSKNKYLYRYPLIQYKLIGKNPSLVCISEGTDEIHHFFENKGKVILINGHEHELQIKKLYLNEFVMQVWNQIFHYQIQRWLPLNEENFFQFQQLDDENRKNEFLTKILVANIISMAKGIDWCIDKQVIAKITNVNSIRTVYYKKVRLLSFNVEFDCNVFIPNYIGLGKGVSKGFGMVLQKRGLKQATNS